MKILCIDSSGKSAAAAVVENEKVLASAFTNCGLTHSQTLLPMIDKMLNDANLSICDADAFALTNGPGSFTGLRIGMALVMGLANNKPCFAVSTLKALAYNLLDHDGIIVPVMDARRSQVYTAIYKNERGKITQVFDECAISVDEVIKNLEQYKGQKIYLLGDGAYLFEGKADFIEFAPQDKLFLKGESIAFAAKNSKPTDAADLKINYLRLSQAERELKEKNKND